MSEEITKLDDGQAILKQKLAQNGYEVRIYKTDSTETPYRCVLTSTQPNQKSSVVGRTILEALTNALRGAGVA
jgi:hypothetical protein